MLVKFLRPVGGMAYFDGDVADLNSSVAAPLIAQGFCIMIPDTEYEPVNPLPEDLPFREKLYNEGYDSIGMLKNAPVKSLESIKGVGKKGAEKVITYLNN